MSLQDKQLVISSNQAEGSPISFALTDAQFERALAVFKPPAPTKPNLWTNKEFSKKLIKVSAYLESVQYMRPNLLCCFSQTLISNHFDNCMIQKFGETEEYFTFSIDEWFNDTRGEVSEKLRNWDPQGVEPMPQLDIQTDWYGALTETELAYPGFVDLFSNCIDLEEETEAAIAKRKHGASTAFGSHPGEQGTPMPESINHTANFDKFTPSGLLGGGGSGLKFKGSGLL